MPPSDNASIVREVLMVVDAVGGVWTYALDLARTLANRGVHVSLAVIGPAPSDAQRSDAALIPGMSVFEHPCALEWMDDPWLDVDESGDWLLDLANHVAPDVVHLNGYCHASLAWRRPVVVTGHSCVLSWWRAVHGTHPPAVWERYAQRVGEGLRHADLAVAPTSAMLAMLDFHYGPLGRRRVILNGRDAESFSAGAPKEDFVLTAGRIWDQAKNVEAVASVAPGIAWAVYIAGESREPAGRTVSYDDVCCLGRLSARELAGWMRRAAVYALPARYEPFGLSILEAALAGCALVLGDIGSLREIWGDTALYVPPDNRPALARALDGLADDREWRDDLAARAQARAGALTAQRMGDAYHDAYCDVVRHRLPLSA